MDQVIAERDKYKTERDNFQMQSAVNQANYDESRKIISSLEAKVDECQASNQTQAAQAPQQYEPAVFGAQSAKTMHARNTQRSDRSSYASTRPDPSTWATAPNRGRKTYSGSWATRGGMRTKKNRISNNKSRRASR